VPGAPLAAAECGRLAQAPAPGKPSNASGVTIGHNRIEHPIIGCSASPADRHTSAERYAAGPFREVRWAVRRVQAVIARRAGRRSSVRNRHAQAAYFSPNQSFRCLRTRSANESKAARQLSFSWRRLSSPTATSVALRRAMIARASLNSRPMLSSLPQTTSTPNGRPSTRSTSAGRCSSASATASCSSSAEPPSDAGYRLAAISSQRGSPFEIRSSAAAQRLGDATSDRRVAFAPLARISFAMSAADTLCPPNATVALAARSRSEARTGTRSRSIDRTSAPG
jgi:hypothetical protein